MTTPINLKERYCGVCNSECDYIFDSVSSINHIVTQHYLAYCPTCGVQPLVYFEKDKVSTRVKEVADLYAEILFLKNKT